MRLARMVGRAEEVFEGLDAVLDWLKSPNAALGARYLMIPAILPKNLKIERWAPDELPANWRSLVAREELQALGSEWVKARSNAMLAVPSAVIPAETNYLLNPMHPQFGSIEIGEAEELITDLRLLNR